MRFLCQRDKYPRCHYQTLKLLISELPTFFPVLIWICDLEGSEFLPHDVSRVVLALIRIRLSTFADSEQRFSDDYIPYDEGVDCTQFYPTHTIHTWPKLFNVGSSTDKDSCDKNFSSHSHLQHWLCQQVFDYLRLRVNAPFGVPMTFFFHFLTSRVVKYIYLQWSNFWLCVRAPPVYS